MPEIKILDTDAFFCDSPNAGEPGCLCSRCKKQIEENEVPLRVAVDQEALYAKDQAGKEKPFLSDLANGYEFRLCEACTKQAGLAVSSVPLFG